MGLFWKAPIHKTVALLDQSGKRELFWYGVTIGQIGFGFLASEKRQPTQRAADLLPCGHPKSSLVQLRFGSLPYCGDCKRATSR